MGNIESSEDLKVAHVDITHHCIVLGTQDGTFIDNPYTFSITLPNSFTWEMQMTHEEWEFLREFFRRLFKEENKLSTTPLEEK